MKPLPIITRQEAKALGLKRYFTGIPCPSGHLSERWVCDWRCYECKKLQCRKDGSYYRLKDKDRNRRFYQKHKDRLLMEKKIERMKNIEKMRSYEKEAARKRRDRANILIGIAKHFLTQT